MESEKLLLLHEHYRDTCGVMQQQRRARDRYFYLVILVLVIALYDVATPEGFATTIADVLKTRFGLSKSPDLAYIRTLLWFLMLGLTVRYGQAALGVERQYRYIHELENTLSEHVKGGFRREGDAYLSQYPLFLSWAHYLYTLVFPLLLSAVVVAWTWHQIPACFPWPLTVWLNCIITVAILCSIGMYLHAFHGWNRTRTVPGAVTRAGSADEA